MKPENVTPEKIRDFAHNSALGEDVNLDKLPSVALESFYQDAANRVKVIGNELPKAQRAQVGSYADRVKASGKPDPKLAI